MPRGLFAVGTTGGVPGAFLYFLRSKKKTRSEEEGLSLMMMVVARGARNGLLFLGVLLGHVARQTAQSLGAAAPQSGQATTPSNSANGSGPQTIRVQVRRVVVDVTVTDAKGKPVPGLTQSDFTVTEDGVAQTLRSFEIHKNDPQLALSAPKLPADTFSNFASAPSGGPITVILYDLLNTPRDSQPFAHAQLLDFLKQRDHAGQVAIFVLSDRLHMLQGFTDDDNKLIAALNLQKAKGYRSTLLQTGGEATQQSDQLAETSGNPDAAAAAGLKDSSLQAVTNMLKNMETEESSYLLDQRVDLTAQALQQIARFLISLPGRKNLLWLSGGFPSGIVPDTAVNGRDPATGRNEFAASRDYSQQIVEASDLLNLSHVAVYPVDVRGLQVNPMYSAGNRQTVQLGGGSQRDFGTALAAEHATMDSIADATGGRAFYNTNGLKEAAAGAVAEGSIYYTLTYAPSNNKTDGKLRKVTVRLREPGYRLAYRQGYFADGSQEAAKAMQDTPTDPLAVTLEHGAPAAHDLFFEAHVTPKGEPVPATADQMADLVKYEAMATRNRRKQAQELNKPVMLQQYIVEYGLLPRQLDLPIGPDGKRRGHLEFAAVSYDDDGLSLNGERTTVEDVIEPERYAFMLDSGYHMLQSVMVPVSARSLRLGVRDVSDHRMGSMEIPLPIAPDTATVPNAPQGPVGTQATPAATAPPGKF